MSAERLVRVIAQVAARWTDPDYEPREVASRLTLEEENAFTPEALIFATNQQMGQLREDALLNWIGNRRASSPVTVGVVNPGNVPLAGLQDLLAVILTGHDYLGKVSRRSPHLLPAFTADLAESGASVSISFADADELLVRASALIATGSDETAHRIRARARGVGIPDSRMLVRGHRYSVAVIGPNESAKTLEGLAEDVLLHEGGGCRNIAVLFAPQTETPDDLLSSMARFRSVFPAHEKTRGSLKLQIAYHAAIETPHGHADDSSFLVTKGEPEPQPPGHLRWTNYADLNDVAQWVKKHSDKLQVVACSAAVRDRLGELPVEMVHIGDCQRPPLGWQQDRRDVIDFLNSLAETRA